MVLCLSQDAPCTDSFENFRDNSLKGGLSNAATFNPPLFSLVDTFKVSHVEIFNGDISVYSFSGYSIHDV